MLKRIIPTLLLLLAVIQPALAVNRTYYVSKLGSDSKDGRSWQNAWSTIDKVNSTITAGDTVRFGTGIWYNSQIRPPQGGDIYHQTVYACSTFSAASKHDPKIYGGEIVTGWAQYSGNIYGKQWTADGGYEYGCGTLVQDEVPMQMIDPGYTSLSAGRYYYSDGWIYVWCFNNANPNDHEMIASGKPPVYFAAYNPDIAYVKIWGLDLRYGQQATVYFNARTNHISIEHCNIGSAGHTAANAAGVFASADDNGKQMGNPNTFGHYNTVRACDIGNLRSLLTSWCTIGTGDGIILYSENYFTIDSCYFYAPIGTGINFKNQAGAASSTGRVAKFNTIIGTARQGIDIWKHPYKDSIYGNIIVNSNTHGIFIHTSNNPWDGDIVVFNNTVYNSGDRGIEIWDDGGIGHCGDGVEIRYNVFHTAFVGVAFSYWGSNTCQNACVIDDNMYYNISHGNQCSGGSSWSAWQGCGFDLGGSYGVNPGFDDIASGDFTRPGAVQEMSRGDYGDRYWTVWGAVQPVSDCSLPSTPALVSPSNGGTDVGWPVVFDWSDVPGNIRYQIQVDTDANFVGPVIDFQPSQSTYSTSGLYPETLHYWRVRVLNDCGWGSWTSARTFTTSGLIVDAEEDLAFATECEGDYHTSQPTLVVRNASLDEGNIYNFEVAMDSLFANIAAASSTVVQQPGKTTAWKVDKRLDAGTDYYWRASVNLDEYSDACKFRVNPMTHMYPDPFRLNDVQHVTFTEIPDGYALLVVTTTGERVRRWEHTDGGDIIWDGTNERGESVAPGVYLWYVEELDIRGKFTVIR
jgi:hypothetical protein